MGTNIFIESCKTFIVKNFGIVLDEKIIPVESIGIITYIGNGKVKMSWKHEGNKEAIVTNISIDEFWSLVGHEYIIDITKVRKPNTEPLFKIGDLVDNKLERCIITSSRYNYQAKTWQYITSRIGHDFELIHDDFWDDEKDLTPVNEVENKIEFKGQEYIISIAKSE